MATKAHNTTAKQLNQADIAINNTLTDPEICTRVAPRGYTTVKLTGLKDLYDRTVAAVSTKTAVEGDKEHATDQIAIIYTAAHLAYQDLATTARRAFHTQPAYLTLLGLTGEEPHATADFIKGATVLFDNADRPEVAAVLADKGYTPEFLASERAKVVAFDQANQVQEAAKGSSEGGTLDQNTLLAQLHTEVMAYLDAAKIALRDRPDLQEKIGLKAPDRQAAAQKAAATKAAKKTASK